MELLLRLPEAGKAVDAGPAAQGKGQGARGHKDLAEQDEHNTEAIVAQLTELLDPVVRSEGLMLVELTYRPEERGLVLRLYVDRPEGGITLPECQGLSRQISDLLDVEDVVPDSYLLEVSSPGLTRRLKSRREFEMFAGRLAKLIVRNEEGRSNKLVGTLKGLMGDDVLIEVKGKVQAIPIDTVAKARLEIDI